MRIKLVLFFSFICLSNAYSQEEPEWVLAKYKDGSTYFGQKLNEQGSNVSMLLHTGDTINIHRYRANEYYDSSNAKIYRDGKFFKNTGSFYLMTLGFNAEGISEEADEPVSAHFGFHYGYRFTPKVSLSGGLGIEFNEANAGGFVFETQYSALYAYGRYHFFTGRPQIFGFGRFGYGFPGEEDSDEFPSEAVGGINAMYGAGVIFASRHKSKFVLSLGHYFQKTKGEQTFLDPIGNEVNTKFDLLIQRLILTLGWEIN